MNELIYLICGLATVCTLGYANGRFRQRVAIWGHPPDLMLGLLGFVVFLPLVLQGYSAWWTLIPLLFAGAGLGAFVHVICTGKGAKARPPELPRVIYGVEMLDHYYGQLASLRFKPRRDEFRELALRNATTEEQFEAWAKPKEWL
jgi:hypothetical protein